MISFVIIPLIYWLFEIAVPHWEELIFISIVANEAIRNRYADDYKSELRPKGPEKRMFGIALLYGPAKKE